MNQLEIRSHGRSSRGSALTLATLLAAACAQPTPVPTYEVVPRDFTHRVTAEGFLRPTEVMLVKVPDEAPADARILWRADDGIEVELGEVVALLDRVETIRRVQKEEVDLASADVRRDQTKVEGDARIGEVASRQHEAQLELDHAERFRRLDGDLYSRREILQSEIDEQLARVRQDQAGELKRLQRGIAATELSLVEVDRRRAADEVSRARRALAALEVKAPQRGILSWVRDGRGDLPQIGEQVWEGETLAEIPQLSQLGIEAFVVEADVGGIVPGREATVTLDAHPELSYRARVTRVDPVAQAALPWLACAVLRDRARARHHRPRGHEAGPAGHRRHPGRSGRAGPGGAAPGVVLGARAPTSSIARSDSSFERTPVQVSALARGLAGRRFRPRRRQPGGARGAGEDSDQGWLRQALDTFMGRR